MTKVNQFFSVDHMSCPYISITLEKDLLKQHEAFNGTYKYLKQIDGQPIWRSLKLSSNNLDTVSNAIWKNGKNSINGDWMIGEMKNLQDPKIRGTGCKAAPDECKNWIWRTDNNDWTQWKTSRESGINVACMKAGKGRGTSINDVRFMVR